MIKTYRIKLKLTKSQFKLVKEKQIESANCWNYIVRLSNEYYHKHKKWIKRGEIQTLTKGKFSLHSQTIQGISDKFDANRSTISQLRKKGNTKARYPYKTKKFYIIPFKAKAINTKNKGKLKLSMAKGVYLELDLNIPNIKTAEIVWKNGYYLYYTFDSGILNTISDGTNIIGVDLGEIHSIACVTNEGKGLVISNREGRSIKRFRNKMYAYISKRLSRCKKGSRQSKKLLKLKNKIRIKTHNKLMNLYHQTTRKFIDFCLEQQVYKIVIGNLKGIEKNIKKNRKLNRVNRQKIAQMEYGRITNYIKYKGKEKGIEVELVKEYYTSQTCPKCSKKHKPQGRTYSCICGYKAHRDIIGAWNILNKKYKYDLVVFKISHRQPINLK